MRLTVAVALVLGSAGCGQGASDNVMASSANALTPAQVDLALGPELPNAAAGDQADSSSGARAVSSADAVEAADTEDALDESVPDETGGEPPAANNGV